MKREIKFRAFHKVNKQMEYEGWNERNGNSTYCSKTTLFMYGEDAEIMQFTGLLDKNGKEIYEGDFVNYSFDDVLNIESGDYIKFDAGYFQIYREGKSYHPVVSDASGIEVIGNIYENPELITQSINQIKA